MELSEQSLRRVRNIVLSLTLLWDFSFSFLLSCSLVDISPPAQGVDHRHVQKELGEVIVRLHNPVVLSPTTIQVTWTVSIA